MSSFIIADRGKLLLNYIGLYLVCFHGVRWFGGLTSVFAGLLQFAARTGNGKSKNKGNRWVVAPFGLHSGLRQSGGRCAAGPDARGKARAHPRSNEKDNRKNNTKSKK